MAKDGTNRGGRRVRAGAKPDPLNEKLAKGLPATRLEDPLASPFDFEGANVGDGAVLAGEVMPEPSEYFNAMANPWVLIWCIGRRGAGLMSAAAPGLFLSA